jgi:serine/threonine protein phosphatase 1
MTIYAIGDIHGHLDLLHAAHDRVAADRAREGTEDAALIHLGDLVDRGPDSAGVVACLRALVAQDPRVTVLKGNHDNMFALYAQDPPRADPNLRPDLDWLHPRLGGRETLASYGIDPDLPPADLHRETLCAVPQADIAFLCALPLSVAQDGVLAVHAGLRPGLALADQAPGDLYWIRDAFLNDRSDHGALVVHGHSPVKQVELHPNRLAVDTGAAYGGPLSAVAIEGRAVFLLTDRGRVPVRPLP